MKNELYLLHKLIGRVTKEQRIVDKDIDDYREHGEDQQDYPDYNIAIGWDEALYWVLKQIHEVEDELEKEGTTL